MFWLFPFLRWEGGESPFASTGWRRYYRRVLLKREFLLTLLILLILPNLILFFFFRPSIQSLFTQQMTSRLMINIFNVILKTLSSFMFVLYFYLFLRPHASAAMSNQLGTIPQMPSHYYARLLVRAICWLMIVDVLFTIYGLYALTQMYMSSQFPTSIWSLVYLYANKPLWLLQSLARHYWQAAVLIPFLMRRRQHPAGFIAAIVWLTVASWLTTKISLLFISLPINKIRVILNVRDSGLFDIFGGILYLGLSLALILWARWIVRQTAGRFWEWQEMKGSVWSPRFFGEVTGLDRVAREIGRAIKRAREF